MLKPVLAKKPSKVKVSLKKRKPAYSSYATIPKHTITLPKSKHHLPVAPIGIRDLPPEPKAASLIPVQETYPQSCSTISKRKLSESMLQYSGILDDDNEAAGQNDLMQVEPPVTS